MLPILLSVLLGATFGAAFAFLPLRYVVLLVVYFGFVGWIFCLLAMTDDEDETVSVAGEPDYASWSEYDYRCDEAEHELDSCEDEQ